MKQRVVRYIDLFAGLGGIRLGLENALQKSDLKGQCVFTSEIKPHAIKVYEKNFPGEKIHGDITQIAPSDIPDFDVLLAGFPCQPFSSAGARKGFMDTRGTLFFTIEEILKEKKPDAFILENVEGLITHDRVDKTKPIGRTLETILAHLDDLGYQVSWKLVDASKHGVPQKRKRIYIVGSLSKQVDLSHLTEAQSQFGDVLESAVESKYTIESVLAKKLLDHYPASELVGKQIKDKRGGKDNIHSWDVGLRGEVTDEQKVLLDSILRQRRRKDWAKLKGIKWSDGMPLTLEDIWSFAPALLKKSSRNKVHLQRVLDDLVDKKYLVREKPKQAQERGDLLGYNIVAGKLSFDISNILDPKGLTPTLVATDVTKMAVVDGNKLRRLTTREGLRLFGFPEYYDITDVSYKDAFDLLGNSVSINVVELVSNRLVTALYQDSEVKNPIELSEPIPLVRQFALDSALESA